MSHSSGCLDLCFLKSHGYHFGAKVNKKSLSKVKKDCDILACKIASHEKKIERKVKIDENCFEILKTLSRVPHPHIIPIHSIVQNGNFTYIFMPWIEEGNLQDHIGRFGMVKESTANLWFHQMSCAVKHIHAMNYAHCNLTCDCIMISRSGVKISGLHKIQQYSQVTAKLHRLTAAHYLAPELNFRHTSIDARKCDIYALGSILFTMLNGIFPFNGSDMTQLVDDQKNRRYHLRTSNIEKLSIECQAMIHTLLEPNSEVRWNIEKVCGMKWLAKFNDKQGDS